MRWKVVGKSLVPACMLETPRVSTGFELTFPQIDASAQTVEPAAACARALDVSWLRPFRATHRH